MPIGKARSGCQLCDPIASSRGKPVKTIIPSPPPSLSAQFSQPRAVECHRYDWNRIHRGDLVSLATVVVVPARPTDPLAEHSQRTSPPPQRATPRRRTSARRASQRRSSLPPRFFDIVRGTRHAGFSQRGRSPRTTGGRGTERGRTRTRRGRSGRGGTGTPSEERRRRRNRGGADFVSAKMVQ